MDHEVKETFYIDKVQITTYLLQLFIHKILTPLLFRSKIKYIF